ncbi:MAG TPA: indole-3-glycerol phosphate synthase TrpC [Gemmatimonadaceae bacterium]|nr:indole-3-glycerol phosphate synthase TrpC [Gemmatimonadaceae bacterium]
MQAFPSWTPPGGTLGRILDETRDRIAALKARTSALESALDSAPPISSFASALRGKDVAIIAEVKRRSPSKGTINAGIAAAAQGRAYQDGGAKAVSVLTEEANFGGTPEDLREVRGAIWLPVLKKDFHVDPVQVLEARVLGASALLLIARALTPAALEELARLAVQAGIEPVIEVRDRRELEVAIATGAPVIGVNARDLETLEVDRGVCEELIPLIPSDRIAVFESSVRDRAGVEGAAALGADAVLVGSAVSQAARPADAVRSLAGVTRRSRD